MKKSHLPLAIILTVLITVILIASVLLVVVLSMDTSQDDPVKSTTTTPSAMVNTTPKPDNGTTTTTTTTTTTPASPDDPKETTAKPNPDNPTPDNPPKPVTTVKPDQTNKPITPTPTPGLSEISGTVKGDSIDSLGIYAKYVTEEIDKNAKTIKLRFTFYLQSYGLRIGARGDNYLVVNGETYNKLSTNKIDLPNGSPLTQTVLYEYEVEIQKPDNNTPVHLELEYFWHFQGTYAGEHADWLSAKVDLTI